MPPATVTGGGVAVFGAGWQLERECRTRAAALGLPSPYNETSWVEHIAQLMGFPIQVGILTPEYRAAMERESACHVSGHTFPFRDHCRTLIDPDLDLEVRRMTIAHELAHVATGDVRPHGGSTVGEAPGRTLYGGEGLDVPGVFDLMMTSGHSRSRMRKSRQERRAEQMATFLILDSRDHGPRPSGDDVSRFWGWS